jgi:ribosomal protein S18 acetylase RimI-like enzyme
MGLLLVAFAAIVALTVFILVRPAAELGIRFARRRAKARGTKFVCLDGTLEVARTYLYILRNDLHEQPFGYIEDVFCEPAYRGRGLVSRLHEMAVAEARRRGCYKIVLSSRKGRADVHAMYRHLGYQERGVSFRLDLDETKDHPEG